MMQISTGKNVQYVKFVSGKQPILTTATVRVPPVDIRNLPAAALPVAALPVAALPVAVPPVAEAPAVDPPAVVLPAAALPADIIAAPAVAAVAPEDPAPEAAQRQRHLQEAGSRIRMAGGISIQTEHGRQTAG